MFKITFMNGDYDILPRKYLDCEYDSVNGRWIFYHKNGRDHRYYNESDVKWVQRI